MRRLLKDESGLSQIEWLGVAVAVLSILVFVPQIRGAVGDLYSEWIWDRVGPRGYLVGIGSFLIFGGTVFVLLYTNLGLKLGFLVSGAALFGFGVISGILFVLYSPRGPRPTDLEGLNAVQIRIIPGAMMIGSAILFAMFLAALSRLEAADQAAAE